MQDTKLYSHNATQREYTLEPLKTIVSDRMGTNYDFILIVSPFHGYSNIKLPSFCNYFFPACLFSCLHLITMLLPYCKQCVCRCFKFITLHLNANLAVFCAQNRLLLCSPTVQYSLNTSNHEVPTKTGCKYLRV